ncbi:hypothetical protein MUO14_09065 [Halobacillus shinanisalinarum]|uniref:Quinate/shikimate 5-dehydrogenase/glutamyl-tRNA reductase domain-containing protein n=1 Tax=Halobacillus shinanisalinarum TaxID=2932258 RepID=A0ABY4H429_9BACI|nr:hypothetical protein [Halobacillus shinanisalinarum]UOQ95056.1 hypothetical protein MUO14_09065 [Halobacillus shinanisalinarum]
MDIKSILGQELFYLKKYEQTSIMINTTAKNSLDFRILPRRTISKMAMSCFMVNNQNLLEETLSFFDGKVDYIYIDIEQKQNINLFKIAKKIIKKSRLVTVKPNDSTVESCDILIRNFLNDDLYNKKVVVIGTGNLASKIAMRLAERQAYVYIVGRSREKENTAVEALNLFLPKYTPRIQSLEKTQLSEKVEAVISFISGQFTRDELLFPVIGKETFIIDGGINNFSSDFIQRLLLMNINITRLDTRIAFPYQILWAHEYTQTFFKEVFGQTFIKDIAVVSGGYIATEGTVIVDNLKHPNQVIGIADGSGGVKSDEELTETNRGSIHKIKQAVSGEY